MKVTYENDFLVFDINKGPKSVIEALDEKGKEGWFPTTSINVAGTQLVFFLVKPTYTLPDMVNDETKHLNKIWSGRNDG
jgi:hypothetical protein